MNTETNMATLVRPRKRRVVWTNAEHRLVAERAAELRLDDPTLSLLHALQRAQDEKLPPERHRRMGGVQSAGATYTLAQTAYSEKVSKRQQEQLPVVIEREKVIEPPLTELLAKAPTDAVLRELVRRVSSVLSSLERLAIGPKSTIPSPILPAFPRNPPEQPRAKRVRVVIVGLLNGQTHEVEERAKAFNFDLRFYDKDKSPGRELVGDWVIVQRHSSHAWFTKAQSAVGRDRVLFADGGIEAVMSKLNDINSRIGQVAV